MELRLYDSFTRSLRDFKPLNPAPQDVQAEVGMYTCGLTVYDYAHIGNMRTFIFEDILRRVLLLNGYKVKHVMNITDVGHLVSDADTGEDKMEKGARTDRKNCLGDCRILYASISQGYGSPQSLDANHPMQGN